MHKLSRSKLRFIRIAFAVFLMVFAISAFWSYRVRAAGEQAAQFAPADTRSILVPAGTVIPAVVRSGVASSAQPGDTVRAFTNRVTVGEKVAIASDTPLRGEIEDLAMLSNGARVQMKFTDILLPSGDISIQTRPVVAVLPIRSEVQIVSNTFRMLIGASVGAAFGAASEDNRMISSGLLEGAMSPESVGQDVPFAVILLRDVSVRP